MLNFPVKKTYVVEKGDTLYGISKKHNVDVLTLSKLNDLSTPYALNVGQILEVPDTIDVDNSSGSTSSFSFRKNATATNKTGVKNTKTVSKNIAKSTPRKTVSTYRKSKFMWPVNGKVVSNFGAVGKGLRNDGINIKAALGTNVKAAEIATELRNEGMCVQFDTVGRGLKPQMKYANKIGALYTLVLGDSELETGNIKLKNMETGNETEMTLSEFSENFQSVVIKDAMSGFESLGIDGVDLSDILGGTN